MQRGADGSLNVDWSWSCSLEDLSRELGEISTVQDKTYQVVRLKVRCSGVQTTYWLDISNEPHPCNDVPVA